MDKTKIKEKRENKEEVTIKHCTLIEWLNSLTFPSEVAICCNLPYDGRVGEKPEERIPKRKMRGSRHQRLLEENARKNKKKVCEY
ncbi:hypothetical protein GmHk_02G004815 [Glycine max]|nr:hypothetical protein GmHk_02G004815 [Glycine max]